MGKRLICFFCTLVVCIGVFAGEVEELLAPEPNYTAVEKVEGKVTTEELKKVGTVRIEYMAAFDEARVIYTCPTPLFEQSNAMKAISESIKNFVKERGYYFYTYLKADLTNYNGDTNTVDYTSYIKLLD